MLAKLASGMPFPESDTLTSTRSDSAFWRVLIVRLCGLGWSSMASMPFITRLIITCCKWIGSDRTGNASGASTVRNTIPRLSTSGETILTTSRTVSFRSTACKSASFLSFNKFRRPRMISLARRSSRTMSERISRTCARSGGLASSNICAASVLLRIAPKGWLSSWAMDEDSTLALVTRFKRTTSRRRLVASASAK